MSATRPPEAAAATLPHLASPLAQTPTPASARSAAGRTLDVGTQPTEAILFSDSATSAPTAGLPGQAPTLVDPGGPARADRTPPTGPSSPSASGARTLELLPHAVLANRYEILALIGEGGMGRVYKARDRELDRVIALKTIRGEAANDPDVVARFKRELVLSRRVSHRNVIRIHDIGEADGVRFFTMEFVEGRSLKRLIRERGALPLDEAVALARQVLGALDEAHRQGVVHRDLKPQNVMVDGAGHAFVMDFGIARAEDATGMTATGALVGTPDYMSPEQVHGEKVDGRCDLFSFGVILYEMVTGELPFQAESAVSKIMMRLTHRPRSPRQLRAEVPRYLEQVIYKCLQVDPALRYASAQQVLDDLARGHVDSSLTLRVQRAFARRRRGLTAAAAAAALAVLGAAGWLAWRTLRAGAAAPAVAQGPIVRVAVLPFTNATGAAELEWLRSGLPDMVATDLAQSRFVRPVTGDRTQKVLSELGIAGQSRFDEAALDAVARAAPADAVLHGQFVESGGTLRLDLALRRAGSGVSVPVKVEGASGAVFALVDGLTAEVKAHLDLTPEQLRGDTDRPVAEVSTASLEASRAYQAGLERLQRGANQEAIARLKEATAADARFAMAYARLAEAYRAAGEDPEAEAAVRRASELAGQQTGLPLAQRYFIHATAARVGHDFETAATSYEELAALYPDDPDVQLNLARCYEEMGKLDAARGAYEKVVAREPGYGQAWLDLAWVNVISGRAAEGARLLDAALAQGRFGEDPEALGMAHSILGVAQRETGDLDASMRNLERSLAYREQAGDRRGQAATLSNMGDVYKFRGELERAIDAQRKALAIARGMGDREGESNYLLELGITQKVAGRLDAALATFRETLQIEQEREDRVNLANRLDHIAEIYRLKGRYDDALVYLQQAQAQLAESHERREKAVNFNYIGLVKRAQGLYDDAIEAFLAALPIFREIDYAMGAAEAQVNLAAIYAEQGRYGDAHAAARAGLELYQHLGAGHDTADAQVLLGRLLVELGRPDEAEQAFAASEQAGDGHGHAHQAGGGASPELLLGRGELGRLFGRGDAAAAYEQANYQANVSGRKEIAVRSRVELGRLLLAQDKLDAAERLLTRTRQEASAVRLRPLEARALGALAELQLARGQAEAARRSALEAISMAEKFSGRPVLWPAQLTLGAALAALGRPEEAVDAQARAAATIDWIRGGLTPELGQSFVARPDVQRGLGAAVAALEKAGRNADAEPLKRWLGKPAKGSRS